MQQSDVVGRSSARILPITESSSPEVAVTICIPSFNRAELVTETLDSILAQTDRRWEAIVVDDGSTDDSPAVIADYARRDERIKLVQRSRGPKGACTCRNIAVEMGTGRYVLFLDTDDVLAPYCVEQRVATMDELPDMDFVIFPMLLFTDDIRSAGRLWNVDSDEDDLLRVLRMNPICQGTGTLWRRDSFIASGMWNEELRLWQDIELHLRAFSGRFRYAKRLDLRPDVYIRESDTSLSRGEYHSREKLESRAEVAKKALAILREAGRSELIPEVRYFCSSVVLGATKANYAGMARKVHSWGKREGVLSASDSRRLRTVEFLHMSRLDRMPFFRRLSEKQAQAFVTDSTLGRIQFRRDDANVAA